MSRGGRVALIVAAWVGPLLWLALWSATTTSDGTVVSRPAAVLGDGRWGESLLVLEAYGGPPLRPGDEILRIEDREVATMAGSPVHLTAGRGDVLRYDVRRAAG